MIWSAVRGAPCHSVSIIRLSASEIVLILHL
jgi:hypothetical protein